jgi:hypothetical protein
VNSSHPQPPRDADQQAISDGVAELVVDLLEAVEVDEHDGAAGGRVTAGTLQQMLDAVHEQCAVGQSGERVVQGLVLEAKLRRALVGHVRQRAGHPDRLPIHTATDQSARRHPPPVTVSMTQAMLTLQVVRASGQMGLDRLLQAGPVIGRHAVKPRRRPSLAGSLGQSEDRVPARREVDPAGLQVPVPDPVVGSTGRERVALGLLVADCVADRALQAGRGELLLDEEVGDPERRRLEVELVGGQPGEHDHRRRRAIGEPLAHQLQPGPLSEPVVDQVDVVALHADRAQRVVVVGRPVDLEPADVLLGQHVAGDEVVVLVVLDEEHADACVGDRLVRDEGSVGRLGYGKGLRSHPRTSFRQWPRFL